jgi:peptidoglycan/LPS O-acetylase OafA/YrhL
LIFGELGMGLVFAWVVTGAASGFRGLAGKVLEWSVLEYLGKISYGIYVYHFNVPGLVRYKLAPRLGIPLPESPWLRFPIYAAVTVLIASASWRWMEKPINRLKNRFAYAPR